MQAVASHLGFFDQTLGSSAHENLKGEQKLKALRALIGQKSFCYIGDHEADLNLWKESAEIIAVNPSPSLTKKIHSLDKPTQILRDAKRPWKLILKLIRPHQWVKNALVFLPALAGHKLFVPETFF